MRHIRVKLYKPYKTSQKKAALYNKAAFSYKGFGFIFLIYQIFLLLYHHYQQRFLLM